MDLQTKTITSKKFTKIALLMNRDTQTPFRVDIRTEENLAYKYDIPVYSPSVIAGAKGNSLISTFIRGLVEYGERIAVRQANLPSTNGVAGGFLKSAAIRRAKLETIERDAFIYHFKNSIPFISEERLTPTCSLYKMASAVPNIHCYAAATPSSSILNSPCICIGMAADQNPTLAKKKAVFEFQGQEQRHKKKPGWCKNEAHSPSSIMSFHHCQSRNQENKDYFKTLTEVAPHNRKIKSLDWNLRPLDSTLKFIFYYKAESKDLIELEFGNKTEINGWKQNLYHPIMQN